MADTRVSVLSARRECRLHQTGIPHGRQHLFALGAQCSKFSMAPSGFSHLFRGPLCARPRFHGTSSANDFIFDGFDRPFQSLHGMEPSSRFSNISIDPGLLDVRAGPPLYNTPTAGQPDSRVHSYRVCPFAHTHDGCSTACPLGCVSCDVHPRRRSPKYKVGFARCGCSYGRLFRVLFFFLPDSVARRSRHVAQGSSRANNNSHSSGSYFGDLGGSEFFSLRTSSANPIVKLLLSSQAGRIACSSIEEVYLHHPNHRQRDDFPLGFTSVQWEASDRHRPSIRCPGNVDFRSMGVHAGTEDDVRPLLLRWCRRHR